MEPGVPGFLEALKMGGRALLPGPGIRFLKGLDLASPEAPASLRIGTLRLLF